MLAKTICEKATSKKFQAKLKPYHHHFKKCSKAVRVHNGLADGKVRLGDLVTIPDSDLHHVMDSEAMLAISHAIEDIASEEGTGELISTFQDFENFLPYKARYMGLAEDLDAVRVWGCGKVPQKCGKVDFIQADEAKLLKYWLVLFDSEHARAVLLCKQINRATAFKDKKFIGFYSFNPYLVQSIRWRFNLMSCGLSKVISHWEKSFPFPDFKMRDLDKLIRQPDSVEV
ncbi:MAG TPA: DICT sensory domain-containing protein [Candidatus Methylacidiphilales bacterium]